jgi:hypothetical protein
MLLKIALIVVALIVLRSVEIGDQKQEEKEDQIFEIR